MMEIKKTYISLDFGLLKNLSIHTSHNIYFINITNTNVSEEKLLKRLFDILYLHGFTKIDLINFLKLIKSKILMHKKITMKEILIFYFSNLFHHQLIDRDQKKF